MKHIITPLLFLLFTCIVITSCSKKEATLQPSTIDEMTFILPQGNNDYDQRILNYYNRFGSYLLYKFSNKDAHWSITSWDTSYKLTPAEPAYINNQLDLLDSTFFRYYTDSTLRKYLPTKMLLCSSLKHQATNNYNTQVDCYYLNNSTYTFVYQNFPINWGSSRIQHINGVKDSAVIFRGNVNYAFLRAADVNNKIPRPVEFTILSDYTTALPFANVQTERYKRGFLVGGWPHPAQQLDWQNYIQAIVQNPYSYLSDATGITSEDATPKGILTPVKDPTGLIRAKYQIIVNYYKNNYNINLQRIGNGEQ